LQKFLIQTFLCIMLIFYLIPDGLEVRPLPRILSPSLFQAVTNEVKRILQLKS
jgi:hypothetical protein